MPPGCEGLARTRLSAEQPCARLPCRLVPILLYNCSPPSPANSLLLPESVYCHRTVHSNHDFAKVDSPLVFSSLSRAHAGHGRVTTTGQSHTYQGEPHTHRLGVVR